MPDLQKFRLRRFVEKLINLGEVEAHEEPVELADVSRIVEASDKAVLFRKAGAEGTELVANVGGSRRRLAAAFGVPEDQVIQEYRRRLANPRPVVDVAPEDAPVREVVFEGDEVDLTQLPFHPQHALDGSTLSVVGYRFFDRPGDRHHQCRLPPPQPAQPHRMRHQSHRAVRPSAHLLRQHRPRREATRQLRRRLAPARLYGRNHAHPRRRDRAGRHAARRAGAAG